MKKTCKNERQDLQCFSLTASLIISSSKANTCSHLIAEWLVYSLSQLQLATHPQDCFFNWLNINSWPMLGAAERLI